MPLYLASPKLFVNTRNNMECYGKSGQYFKPDFRLRTAQRLLQTDTQRMPSSKLAPHEQRERWLTVIAGSFPPIVVWHAARDEHVKVIQTMRLLDSHFMTIAAGLQNVPHSTLLHTKCKEIHDLLASLENGYMSAMDWMEETQTIDGDAVTSFQNPERRTQREFVIKQIVIFRRRGEQIGEVVDHFVTNSKFLQQGTTLSAEQKQMHLGNLLKYIEQALDQARLDIRQDYNNGRLFTEYVRNVLENILADKDMYTRWGRHYSYPVPKVIECDDKDSFYWREFGPLQGEVPRIEDDEDAEWLLF